MASRCMGVVRRGAAFAALFMVVLGIVVLGAAGAGEPTDQAAGRTHTDSVLECVMGCATDAMGCSTACSGRPLGDAVDCALACVETNAVCLAGCGPAFRPAPPPA